MLTPPWRIRKWRTSLPANTFLLAELSTSVNIMYKYIIYLIYCFTPYSAPRHEGRPAPALLPRHPAAGAGQVSRTNESAAFGHVTASSPLIGQGGRHGPAAGVRGHLPALGTTGQCVLALGLEPRGHRGPGHRRPGTQPHGHPTGADLRTHGVAPQARQVALIISRYYLDNIHNATARYRHLREEAAYPGSVCPTREGGLELVRLVLAQVMEVHSASTHIHIGCDEVRYSQDLLRMVSSS